MSVFTAFCADNVNACRVYVNMSPPSITEMVGEVNREWLESQPVVPLRSLICVCCLSLYPHQQEHTESISAQPESNLKLSPPIYVAWHFSAFFCAYTRWTGGSQIPRGNLQNNIRTVALYILHPFLGVLSLANFAHIIMFCNMMDLFIITDYINIILLDRFDRYKSNQSIKM